MEKLSPNRPSLTKLTIDSSVVPAGGLVLAAGSGFTVSNQVGSKEVTISKSPVSATIYNDIYDRIIAGKYPYENARWMSGGLNGGFTIQGGTCVSGGYMDKSSSTFLPLQLHNLCPPCVDCKDFRAGEDSILWGPNNTRVPGLFDILDLLDKDAKAELDKILEASGRLDGYKEVVEQYNKLLHLRSVTCKARLVGKVINVSFSYSNLNTESKDFTAKVSFQSTTHINGKCRCLFVDSSSSDGGFAMTVKHDDAELEEWGESKGYVEVSGTAASGQTVSGHVACYMYDPEKPVSKGSAAIHWAQRPPTPKKSNKYPPRQPQGTGTVPSDMSAENYSMRIVNFEFKTDNININKTIETNDGLSKKGKKIIPPMGGDKPAWWGSDRVVTNYPPPRPT